MAEDEVYKDTCAVDKVGVHSDDVATVSETCVTEDDMECGEEGGSRAAKRTHERENSSEDSEWSVVVRGRKTRRQSVSKEVEEVVKVVVTCSTGLPKQFALAKLFQSNNINGITHVKYSHTYRMVVSFEKESDADRFIQCTELKKIGWNTQKSTEVGLSYGLIRDIDLDITEEEIVKNLTCRGEIVSAKRLNKRNYKDDVADGWTKCEAIRLAFRGSSLPTEVFILGMRVKVIPYVFPVSQCSRCWRFGHTRILCPSRKSVCPKCTGDHENCLTTSYKCVNCAGSHMALQKICPAFKKERRIRELMSEYNCTYRKALTMYVPPSPTCERNISPGPALPPVPRRAAAVTTPQRDPAHAPEECPTELPEQLYSEVLQKRKQKKDRRKQTPLPSPSNTSSPSSPVQPTVETTSSPILVTKSCLRKPPPPAVSSHSMETDCNNRASECSEDSDVQGDDSRSNRDSSTKDLSFGRFLMKLYQIVASREKLESKIQQVIKVCADWILPKIISMISAGSLANLLSSYG